MRVGWRTPRVDSLKLAKLNKNWKWKLLKTRTQRSQAICTSVLASSKTLVNKKIYHLNTLHLYTAQTRKRTTKELPNLYTKLLNYPHPIVRFLQKTRACPDESHYKQSRLWSWLQTTLAQITRITPKWVYSILQIFSPFTIFEQLALALKKQSCPAIFHCIEYTVLFTFMIFNHLRLPWKQSLPWKFSLHWIYFYIQEFWATCTCPEKQRLPSIHSTECIFFSFRISEQLALSLKTELPWNFALYWIYFLHSGFLTTCTCPENRACPWNFSLYWIYFLTFRIFIATLRLPWNFSLCWIYFLHSEVLSSLRLPWKTEGALNSLC